MRAWFGLFSIWALVCTGPSPLSAQERDLRDSPFVREVTPVQLESAYVHGTIDVIVSTREGFVLASDSRATLVAVNHAPSFSDDAQKVFPVGNRAACIIAGTIGSELNMEGFRLRDAVGSHLVRLDQQVSAQKQVITADEIAVRFSRALQSVAGLLPTSSAIRSTIVSAAMAVSISADGQPEWLTFYVPLDIRSVDATNQSYFAAAQPIFVRHSQDLLGLRFDIDAIGFPFIVQQLVRANTPREGAPEAMKLFYERKRSGRLNDYTLKEGIELARALVGATIAAAPQEAGVGGSIDILTLTKDGTRWIQRKERNAPFPSIPGPLMVSYEFGNGDQPLDGMNCVRCRFFNVNFVYAGNADVELLAPEVSGHCRVAILPTARQKMPETADRLVRTLGPKCEVVDAAAVTKAN